jgi:hypothetical protein
VSNAQVGSTGATGNTSSNAGAVPSSATLTGPTTLGVVSFTSYTSSGGAGAYPGGEDPLNKVGGNGGTGGTIVGTYTAAQISTSKSYTVGAAGNGGTGDQGNGSSGQAGKISITEFFS